MIHLQLDKDQPLSNCFVIFFWEKIWTLNFESNKTFNTLIIPGNLILDHNYNSAHSRRRHTNQHSRGVVRGKTWLSIIVKFSFWYRWLAVNSSKFCCCNHISSQPASTRQMILFWWCCCGKQAIGAKNSPNSQANQFSLGGVPQKWGSAPPQRQ